MRMLCDLGGSIGGVNDRGWFGKVSGLISDACTSYLSYEVQV